MNREQIINLYGIIRELKATKLNIDARKQYTLLRIEMVKLFKEFEEAKTEIAEQTKCEDEQKWNEEFQEIIKEWLNVNVELDTKIFTVEECVDFITSNDLSGVVEDFIIELMINETK